MEENREAYNNIDSDTREVLEVIAKVRIPEEYKVKKNGEERFEMCKAFEDYRLEGKMEGKLEGEREGMQKHLIQAVCKKLQKNKPAEIITEELEEELSEVEKVIEAQLRVGSYDVEQIYRALIK